MDATSETLALQEAPALKFTDAAARKVGDLIRGEGNPKLMLRVFVQGGGCSGLQYGFEFDEAIQEGDTCVENLGVKLLVDPMSVQYLTGAEIDYREGLEGARGGVLVDPAVLLHTGGESHHLAQPVDDDDLPV